MVSVFGGRSSGVLLHPTSLPSPYGIGDLGPQAYAWIDTLVRARQSWWQILPLGPTGYGDSPYQCFSAFAGNPLLISPDILLQDGLLSTDDLQVMRDRFPPNHVDFGQVIPARWTMLRHAWKNFQEGRGAALRHDFEQFCHEQAMWLADYALFMALKDHHQGQPWYAWERSIVLRSSEAIREARIELAIPVQTYQFVQFLFFRQWKNLIDYAHDRGLFLIGDVPIFIAGDSADVWANPELFLLDEERRQTAVAGVPPDYFSPTGQLWGNPLYDWEASRQTGYAWWLRRLEQMMHLVDLVRLDHFRGFAAAWHVPAGENTAVNGQWVPGPGADLIEAIRQGLGSLPIIAEDLGEITPDVDELRHRYDLPGMRILQFAFGGATENRFLPHHYERNTVVYTGTHDNDTTLSWYHSIGDEERQLMHRYLGFTSTEVVWDLIRLAWASVADLAVVPVQDLLSLGNEARMNFPGKAAGNWSWRLLPGQLGDEVIDRLAEFTELYSRVRTE